MNIKQALEVAADLASCIKSNYLEISGYANDGDLQLKTFGTNVLQSSKNMAERLRAYTSEDRKAIILNVTRDSNDGCIWLRVTIDYEADKAESADSAAA
jgi:hypothetical protein